MHPLRHKKRFTCDILHKAAPIYDVRLPIDGRCSLSWGLTWRNVKCERGRRKTLPSLGLIQKAEHRSRGFRKL
jgi:hypothetical protein